MTKPRIIRATTIPISAEVFVAPMLPLLEEKYEVVFLSSDGPEWKNLERHQAAARQQGSNQTAPGNIVIHMERHISLKNDLKALWKVWRAIRKIKPQMVHSMTPKAGLLCMIASWLARVPVRVHTFTGLVFPTATGLKRKILIATDWLTCACATHIIPEGEGVKRDLQTYVTKKPMKVLGYGNCKGIDLDLFNPELFLSSELMTDERCKALKDNGCLNFLAIGRLVGDKGINELVEAFCKLNKEHPDTRLVLIGYAEDGLDPLKPETLKNISGNDAIMTIDFQKDVRQWIAACDVSVLASYREGFPNVVIEAGAMGLPQIVTDINGANEIIKDGQNGIIVPPKSAQALYDAMVRMLDKNLRNAMSKNARPMIANRYDARFVRKCLMDFYDEIIK